MEPHLYIAPKPFETEGGRTISGFRLKYHTTGTLSEDLDNVIWVCHALTANSDIEDWWKGMIGIGKVFDPRFHFIICVNIPGSCYGSSGPLTINPETGSPWYHDFPELTTRDIVAAFRTLKNYLGINAIETLIGFSLGGQHALEWAVSFPDEIQNLVLGATNARHSAWGVAFNEAQRLAILADKSFEEKSPKAGIAGLGAARAMALLSYRNYFTYSKDQTDAETIDNPNGLKSISYQRHQAKKLQERFNAFSYIILSKMMDSHNVGRTRNSIESALRKVRAKTLIIGIRSDILFPIIEQKFLANHIQDEVFVEIDSHYGHDGFLVETEKISVCLRAFFREIKFRSSKNQAVLS